MMVTNQDETIQTQTRRRARINVQWIRHPGRASWECRNATLHETAPPLHRATGHLVCYADASRRRRMLATVLGVQSRPVRELTTPAAAARSSSASRTPRVVIRSAGRRRTSPRRCCLRTRPRAGVARTARRPPRHSRRVVRSTGRSEENSSKLACAPSRAPSGNTGQNAVRCRRAPNARPSSATRHSMRCANMVICSFGEGEYQHRFRPGERTSKRRGHTACASSRWTTTACGPRCSGRSGEASPRSCAKRN